MNILIIAPFPVFPPSHGSRARPYRQAMALASAGNRVDVFSPWCPGQPFRSFRRDGVTFHPHRLAANALLFVLGDHWIPPLLTLSLQPLTRRCRARLRRLPAPDVVEFHLCANARWMRHFSRRSKVVYVAHNVEYDYLVQQPRRVPLLARVARRMRDLERLAVQSADLLVTCSEADSDRFRQLYGSLRDVAVVPHGFVEELEPERRRALRARARAALGLDEGEVAALFIGGPAAHNQLAVRMLEQEILPRVRRKMRLLIVGRCSDGHAVPAGLSRVAKLGFVEGLAPVLAAADVAVNPVTSESGANVKMADYLSAGLPVVTTVTGMRGFEHLRDRFTVVGVADFAAALDAMPSHQSWQPARDLSPSHLGERLTALYADLARG